MMFAIIDQKKALSPPFTKNGSPGGSPSKIENTNI
jgi:hypothetical protein